MAAGTVIFTGTLLNPAGTARASAKVVATRLQDKATSSALSAAGVGSADSFSANTDSNGLFTITCTHQTAHVAPLTYKLSFPDGRYAIIPVTVSDNGTTMALGTIVQYDAPVGKDHINITPLITRNLAGRGSSPGTTPVSTVSIAPFDGGVELTLTNFIVGEPGAAAAAKGFGNIVYAYPAGQHLELAYSFRGLVLTAAGTAVNADVGLGSVIASGVVSVLSGTATFEDRLTGQTIGTAAGGGTAVSALTGATAGIGTGIALNVAASIKNVFLNAAGTWNANNTGNMTATGVIVLSWTKM